MDVDWLRPAPDSVLLSLKILVIGVPAPPQRPRQTFRAIAVSDAGQ